VRVFESHLARAAGDAEVSFDLFRNAAAGFWGSDRLLDEARCRSLGVHAAGNVSGTP
jgi:hypothetical protein